MSRDQDETPERRDARLQLENITVGLARMVAAQLEGAECGFAIVLFDYGTEGSMAYASTGIRTDVATMFREVADKIAVGELATKIAAGKPAKAD
jgi:hypothetical protein